MLREGLGWCGGPVSRGTSAPGRDSILICGQWVLSRRTRRFRQAPFIIDAGVFGSRPLHVRRSCVSSGATVASWHTGERSAGRLASHIPHTVSLGDTGWCSYTSADGGTRECTCSAAVPPVVPPAGSPAGSPAGGVTTEPSGAMHCPFWQLPPMQGVPKALGLILPRFAALLAVFAYTCPDDSVRTRRAGAGTSGLGRSRIVGVSVRPNVPRTAPMVAARARRREPVAEKERASVSNRDPSMAVAFRVEGHGRGHHSTLEACAPTSRGRGRCPAGQCRRRRRGDARPAADVERLLPTQRDCSSQDASGSVVPMWLNATRGGRRRHHGMRCERRGGWDGDAPDPCS